MDYFHAMKYSVYLGMIIRNNGIPNLSSSQYGRLFNIVHLEGRLYQCKIHAKGNKDYAINNVKIFKIEKELTILTNNLEPEYLLQEMFTLSK